MIPQLANVSRAVRREMLRQLDRDNRTHPEALRAAPPSLWPKTPAHWEKQIGVWRSRSFMCQAFQEPGGVVRLSFNRTEVDEATLRWRDDITWDDLQRLKREAGFGDQEAVEVFPPDAQIVNVANMRHLWVLPAPLPFSWKSSP